MSDVSSAPSGGSVGYGKRKKGVAYRAGGGGGYTAVLRQFVACGCCSTFITGYRLLHGVEALEQAISAQQEGEMHLSWDKATRQLITQAYDVRLEPDLMLFEMSCPECQRRFSYREGLDGNPAPTFSVDLKL
jgi:hypothetical protein